MIQNEGRYILIDKIMEKFINKAKKDPEVIAAAIFGSKITGNSDSSSDTDICLFLTENNYSVYEMSKKQFEYLREFNFDIQIYKQLPIYIRVRILKEGKFILKKDEDKLYDIAFKTITEYADFEHIYNDYLKEVVNA
jgi:predicted nucleotidyltransferase